MKTRDLYYFLLSMVGGFIVYWIFCLVIVVQNFAVR
jgi:hypothetical protein